MTVPMSKTRAPEEVLPGLWRFEDTCNVYLLKSGEEAIAVDFGSGRWLRHLPALGVRRVTDVFLTHGHADQCFGLLAKRAWPFAVRAPAGEERFLAPEKVRELRRLAARGTSFALNHSLLPRGIRAVACDLPDNREVYWQGLCLRVVSTPGHGPTAVSLIVEFHGKQVAFCGDAAYAGGTLWQPANLEWDHYRPIGAMEAWRGIRRLMSPGLDILCPSHGPVERSPRRCLQLLDRRLQAFIRAKGAVCAGDRDHFVIPEPLPCGALRILPHLYRFGGNSYLLASKSGDTLVVDPYGGAEELEALLKALGLRGPSAMLVSHCHLDHCGAIPWYRKRFGTRAVLHPIVEEALRKGRALHIPYLPDPALKLRADELWPWRGTWRWNEYAFRVAPWPGQTWWHCVFMTAIDGRKVLFGGDSFQPASRWEGTGGFCAANNSRFREGYIPSARLALAWRPDILANGHQATFRFTASRFRRIIRWAQQAERAVRALCPTGDLERDYYALELDSRGAPGARCSRKDN